MRIQQVLSESKANIINLGYPPIVAKLFYEIFGKHAYLMAKWQRDYSVGDRDPSTDWFKQRFDSYEPQKSLYSLVLLYESTSSPEKYSRVRQEVGLSPEDDYEIDADFLSRRRAMFREMIKRKILTDSGSIFDYYSLPQDIMSGKLKDLNRYKNLRFMDAQHLYDQYRIFSETTPLKTYKNGYKWINVGKRCPLIGSLMRNCGSSGVMSNDPDRSILVLFDANNKPHVMVTYSPNQGRVSGDEGAASTEVKNVYHRYVLDLTKLLGARLDDRTKSSLLRVKSILGDVATDIREISSNIWTPIFKFKINSTVYYSDAYSAVTKEQVVQLLSNINSGEINVNLLHARKLATIADVVRVMLNHSNAIRMRALGFTPISLNALASR